MIEIYNLSDLQGMNTVLTEDYVLMNDIDASDTVNWNGGEGFVPIGTGWWADQFQGTFDGQGYTISNLYINRPSSGFQALFGSIRTGSGTFIKNVGLENCEIYGNERVGALVGLNRGTLSNSFATGEITGAYATGGLVGESDTLIENCYSKMTITTSSTNGGIVGISSDVINKCYHSGLITGSAGTKNGISSNGTVTNCFWDTETSLTSVSNGGGTGKTTAEMTVISTYTDITTTGLDDPWDFVGNPNDDVATDDIWNILSSLNDGYPIFDYQASIPEGTTNSATNITHESARLNGELVDPTGEAVDLFFSYKLVSDSTWTEVQKHSNITSPYTFYHDLTGLVSDTDYEFQAIFRWSTNETTGQILQFKTNITPQTPIVTASGVSNNTGTSVILNGELTQLGAESSADLYFEYKKQTDSIWTEIVSDQNVTTEPYSYNETVTGLTEGIFYDYRAVVKWSSDEYKGNIVEFFTLAPPSLYFIKEGIEIPDGRSITFGDNTQGDSLNIIKSNNIDPTDVGVTANVGSLYLHTNGNQYKKTGSADTDWELLIEEAPEDSGIYSRQDGAWVEKDCVLLNTDQEIPSTKTFTTPAKYSSMFDDWFVPSRDEALEICNTMVPAGVGNFSDYYWTSSEEEGDPSDAYIFDASNGNVDYAIWKQYDTIVKTRPIREFTSTTNYNLLDEGPAGGIIFYKDGDYYLECHTVDVTGTVPWEPSPVVGTGLAIGDGKTNTAAIISAEPNSTFAKSSNDLEVGINTVPVNDKDLTDKKYVDTLITALNTAGNLNNVPYLNKENTFTEINNFSHIKSDYIETIREQTESNEIFEWQRWKHINTYDDYIIELVIKNEEYDHTLGIHVIVDGVDKGMVAGYNAANNFFLFGNDNFRYMENFDFVTCSKPLALLDLNGANFTELKNLDNGLYWGSQRIDSGVKVAETETDLTLDRDVHGIVICRGDADINITIPGTSYSEDGDKFTIKNKSNGIVTISGTIDETTDPTLPNKYDHCAFIFAKKGWQNEYWNFI